MAGWSSGRRQPGLDPVSLLLLESDLPGMYDTHELTRKLQKNNGSKIVLLVGDGLGGLPLEPGGKTELETAKTPNSVSKSIS